MTEPHKIHSELSKEKSLWEVYCASRSYSENRLDRAARLLTAIALLTLSFSCFFVRLDVFPAAARATVNWLNLGFTYAVTILGFLVAGFTIFSTMTRTEIFVALAEQVHPDLQVSQLKFIFHSFIRVFILHILLLMSCILALMLRDMSEIYLSPLSVSDAILTKKISVVIILPLIGYGLVSALLHLKTFVWNLYQSIIIAIAGAATLLELEQEPKSKGG